MKLSDIRRKLRSDTSVSRHACNAGIWESWLTTMGEFLCRGVDWRKWDLVRNVPLALNIERVTSSPAAFGQEGYIPGSDSVVNLSPGEVKAGNSSVL